MGTLPRAHNTCCECGEAIITVVRIKGMKKSLEETNLAICRTCNPKSNWRRVKKKEVKG